MAQWNPIGVDIADSRWPYSEYISYVPIIIESYKIGNTGLDCLTELKLSSADDIDNQHAILNAADHIDKLLFELTIEDLNDLLR
ncbi:hypothetical protein ABIB62_001535 [Mucilaginibacter sp. UYP25]|uniref:hypothetical protein n=1 Tax=unclassified Mucilaginibacter TaxID=2617802 RepID=UPI00339A79BA